MTKSADILILGAGVVGLTTALQLAKHGLSVIVFDKTLPQTQSNPTDIDPRVFAIMPKNERYFSDLGVWDAMEKVSPYRSMHVWDEDMNKGIQFSANDVGQTHLGHIIEQRVILQALMTACLKEPKFTLQAPVELLDIQVEEKIAIVKTNQGDFVGSLIIGADGPQSWLRTKQNIPMTQWDYQQQAIVATVTTELSHQQCAAQRFTPTGPLAFLPLQDAHTCSIVWAQDQEKALALMALSDTEFTAALKTAFAAKLGDITSLSPRFSYPLRMRHVKEYVRPRIALVGDAAHTVHPLAGLGMNLGLLDSATLCSTIIAAQKAGRDVGAYHHLRPYERARKGHNWAIIGVMEGFKRLFGTEQSQVTRLRNWGLQRVNTLQVVKNKMIESFN